MFRSAAVLTIASILQVGCRPGPAAGTDAGAATSPPTRVSDDDTRCTRDDECAFEFAGACSCETVPRRADRIRAGAGMHCAMVCDPVRSACRQGHCVVVAMPRPAPPPPVAGPGRSDR